MQSMEESLNASPRSQHFLERCSSPDESPMLSARDPQTKSPPVSTPRRDSLTTDEALLEQPQSTEIQQTLLQLSSEYIFTKIKSIPFYGLYICRRQVTITYYHMGPCAKSETQPNCAISKTKGSNKRTK